MGVNRVTDGEVGNVAGSDPSNHENPEDYVAYPGEAHVFKAFCDLCLIRDKNERGAGSS